MDLHPIEAAWRRFRNTVRADLLRRSLETRASFVRFLKLDRLPNEIVLPGGVAWNLVALDEARARGERTGSSISIEGSLLVNTVHVWAAYREAKVIYTIEPALAECLARSPWPDKTPAAALRLPSRCPVLALPWKGETIYLAAVYDLVTGGEQSGALELRISKYEDDLWVPVSTLHLTRSTLQECVEAAAAEARVHGAPDEAAAVWLNSMGGLALTILLYLRGEPDVVRTVHPGAKLKESIRRRDPERWKDLDEPNLFAVGKEFTRAIERWEIEHGRDAGDPIGRSVRPHMRRAHSHLYWTGAGRAVPRVRFLLPISVKGGVVVEEPERPVAGKVS